MTDADKDKGVIFDLDGVLINTGEFHKQSWYDLAQKEGFDASDEIFYSTFGMQNYQIIPILAGRSLPAEDIERLSEWKEGRYRELAAEKLTLLAGARNLIDDLKDKGFMLAIGTSTPQVNVTFILEQIPALNCFDAFVTGEEVSKGKPHPDTFLIAAEKLSLAPNRCVVVEDAVQGVEAGKAAGMAVVAVTTTRSRDDLKQADLIVDSLAELRAEGFDGLLTHGNQ
ncbi:MAG: HAD family phosphatase [Planctomycetota bacterium]|nr:MAG: HAD family phosphatase [Planctomycetota bacterium]